MLDAPVTPAGRTASAAVRMLRHPLVLTGLIYLAASAALHHRALGAPASTAIGSGTTDHDLFLWWLNWIPWSVLHGENPLFTDFQHFPLGVNGMWNTSVPLLGVLLAPVTLTAGPLVAFNSESSSGRRPRASRWRPPWVPTSERRCRARWRVGCTRSRRSTSRMRRWRTSTSCGRCCRRSCCV
jgi:hypothetical protein